MKRPNYIRMIAGSALIGWMGISEMTAQTALTTEHVDLGLVEGTGLGLHWHDEDNDIEYEPNQAFAFIDPVDALNTIPSGAEWDFLGGSAGGNIWILPQSSDPNLLFLGIGAEDSAGGVFDSWNPGDSRGANIAGAWVELSLQSFTGPGDFSMWQSGLGPTAFMSTATTLAEGNNFYVQEGGHDHVNWGFTALGTYDLTFQVRSFIGASEVTETATFQFTTVPEPSTFLLMCLAGGAVAFRRRYNAGS